MIFVIGELVFTSTILLFMFSVTRPRILYLKREVKPHVPVKRFLKYKYDFLEHLEYAQFATYCARILWKILDKASFFHLVSPTLSALGDNHLPFLMHMRLFFLPTFWSKLLELPFYFLSSWTKSHSWVGYGDTEQNARCSCRLLLGNGSFRTSKYGLHGSPWVMGPWNRFSTFLLVPWWALNIIQMKMDIPTTLNCGSFPEWTPFRMLNCFLTLEYLLQVH